MESSPDSVEGSREFRRSIKVPGEAVSVPILVTLLQSGGNRFKRGCDPDYRKRASADGQAIFLDALCRLNYPAHHESSRACRSEVPRDGGEIGKDQSSIEPVVLWRRPKLREPVEIDEGVRFAPVLEQLGEFFADGGLTRSNGARQ